MPARRITRTIAVAAAATMLVTAMAAPSLARPDKGPKVEAGAEQAARWEAKAEAKAEREAAKAERRRAQLEAKAERRAAHEQAKAERKSVPAQDKAERKAANAVAKTDRRAAHDERKAERRAVRAATAEAKALCKVGGWAELTTADGDPFPNQGRCVSYVVRGGTPVPLEAVEGVEEPEADGTVDEEVPPTEPSETDALPELCEVDPTLPTQDGLRLVFLAPYPQTNIGCPAPDGSQSAD